MISKKYTKTKLENNLTKLMARIRNLKTTKEPSVSFDETIVFRNTHWVTVDGETLTVGITEDCVAEFDDIESIEFPEEGDAVSPDEFCATVLSDSKRINVYSPVHGEIVEVNTTLNTDKSLIEEDPIGEGWIFKVEANDSDEVSQLLSGDAPAYLDDEEEEDEEEELYPDEESDEAFD